MKSCGGIRWRVKSNYSQGENCKKPILKHFFAEETKVKLGFKIVCLLLLLLLLLLCAYCYSYCAVRTGTGSGAGHFGAAASCHSATTCYLGYDLITGFVVGMAEMKI